MVQIFSSKILFLILYKKRMCFFYAFVLYRPQYFDLSLKQLGHTNCMNSLWFYKYIVLFFFGVRLIIPMLYNFLGDRGSTVVKVLCYKSEGRWFDSRWCRNFSLAESFRSHYGPGVDSASNRNEYQEHFLGVKAAGT